MHEGTVCVTTRRTESIHHLVSNLEFWSFGRVVYGVNSAHSVSVNAFGCVRINERNHLKVDADSRS